jgi:uncharacterized protein YjeT (DUF2065 family)
MRDLYAALCLVLVIEGLVLFAVPRGWQQVMRDAAEADPRILRWCGLAAMVIGAVTLRLVF